MATCRKRAAHSAYDMFSSYKYLIVTSVLEWHFLSNCVISSSLPTCTFFCKEQRNKLFEQLHNLMMWLVHLIKFRHIPTLLSEDCLAIHKNSGSFENLPKHDHYKLARVDF